MNATNPVKTNTCSSPSLIGAFKSLGLTKGKASPFAALTEPKKSKKIFDEKVAPTTPSTPRSKVRVFPTTTTTATTPTNKFTTRMLPRVLTKRRSSANAAPTTALCNEPVTITKSDPKPAARVLHAQLRSDASQPHYAECIARLIGKRGDGSCAEQRKIPRFSPTTRIAKILHKFKL